MVLLDQHDTWLQASVTAAFREFTAAQSGVTVVPKFVLIDNQLPDDQRKTYGQWKKNEQGTRGVRGGGKAPTIDYWLSINVHCTMHMRQASDCLLVFQVSWRLV